MITMENKQRVKTIAVIFIIAIVLISLMTEFLYTFNNKYTYNKLQPEKGVLTLSQEEIDNNSFHFLIKDWEFYENALLTPTYFKNQTSLPNMKYISIGDTESAYTSQTKNNIFIGTYRIKINFPEKEGFYALEMPQVYSAYELYINNKLYLKVGDTHNYKAQIQNRCTFFNASGETYITIAVKDASGIRAGITSPPTLGKPYSINITRAFKFLINNFIMTLIFFGALFSLILALSGKSNYSYIFFFMCLTYAVYLNYPLINLCFSMGGNFSYVFEYFCTHFVYLMVIMLQNRLCNLNKNVSSISEICGSVFCAIAFVYGVFTPYLSAPLCTFLSTLCNVFEWLAAIYLVAIGTYAVFNDIKYGRIFLFGNVCFAVSLLLYIIQPLYDSIYTDQSVEIGILTILGCLYFVYWASIIDNYRRNIVLDDERRLMERQINLYKENYVHITEQIEETRKLRHDMRQHFRVISDFANNRQFDKIAEYLEEYSSETNDTVPLFFCENLTLNALLHFYVSSSAKNSIDFKTSVSVPNGLPMSDIDFSILVGNLVENAMEACSKAPLKNRRIVLNCTADKNKLILDLKNTFDGNVKKIGSKFLSFKKGMHGLGLESVNAVVDKYHGVMNVSNSDDMFIVSLVIFF
jgi:hypothetical protein